MTTVKLTLNGHQTEVPAGQTILQAARTLGLTIPTLCHVEGFEASASCFICAVKIEGRPNLWPSCATPVAEGMVVITDSEQVRAARKTALELLLSDHAGDCVGPCRTGCPARLDIPNFIERIAAGDHRQAAEIVTEDLTLPASLGRICPRLCEERCRQCEVKDALSIRNLHRFAADHQRAHRGAVGQASRLPPGRLARGSTEASGIPPNPQAGRLRYSPSAWPSSGQGRRGWLPHITCFSGGTGRCCLMPTRNPAECCATASRLSDCPVKCSMRKSR